MKAMRLLQWLDSPRLFALLCVAAIPLILFRLFGFLFFASTISDWAIVPALVLCGLIASCRMPQPARNVAAAALLLAYLCSVFFHGWPNLMARLNDGGDPTFEAAEALVLGLLALQLLLSQSRWLDN